jgi:RimJ/RimL family protein N-acetyltransferase
MQIETIRTVIRSFTRSDIGEYAGIVCDPEVMRYTGNFEPMGFKEAQEYIEDLISFEKENGYSRFAVVNKENNELMGFCGFKTFNNNLDFGWRYARKFWNQGYGTEVAKEVFEYGKTVLNLDSIVCVAYSENMGSIKIFEKLGMKFCGNIKLKNRDALKYIWERK